MDIASNIPRPAGRRFHDLDPGSQEPDVQGPPEGPAICRRYVGSAVSLYDWHCAGHGPAHPDEECSESHEVVVPRRGAFEWRTGRERLLADPGTATFFHPDQSYRVRHPVPGGDAGSVFRVSPACVRALVAEHDPAAAERTRVRFPASHAPLDGRAYLLGRQAIQAAIAGADDVEIEERALGFLRSAMAQAYRRRSPTVPESLAAEYAARVAEVIAAHYRERLTLAGIAGVVGVSPFHLSRLVSATTGVSIYRMIVRRRLREAVELLLETRAGISAIALEVGFASHSHLTDAFRREFGVPPRAVRAGRPFRARRR